MSPLPISYAAFLGSPSSSPYRDNFARKNPGLEFHMLTCANSLSLVSTPSRPSHMVITIRHLAKATVCCDDIL